MKKDGFVSMTLVYVFLILFLFLMIAILNSYSQQNKFLTAIDSKIDMSISMPKIDSYCPYEKGQIFEYNYTGDEQSFIAACNGIYKVELWGAQGGSGINNANKGGKGAYTSGEIRLDKNSVLYIYVGQYPTTVSTDCQATNLNSSFNGITLGSCSGGGGATDVRLVNGSWNSPQGLNSRIMVAAGGGGAYYDDNNSYQGGAGGGLIGYPGVGGTNVGLGGSQISSSFGIGTYGSSNGAGGYYGGLGGDSSNGGGGSSFISGHEGCIAISSSLSTSPRTNSNSEQCNVNDNDIVCSYHYSNMIFTKTVMIDGEGYNWTFEKENLIYMPTHDGTNGTMIGNSENGFARITYLKEE